MKPASSKAVLLSMGGAVLLGMKACSYFQPPDVRPPALEGPRLPVETPRPAEAPESPAVKEAPPGRQAPEKPPERKRENPDAGAPERERPSPHNPLREELQTRLAIAE
jgi:hypothetical protein